MARVQRAAGLAIGPALALAAGGMSPALAQPATPTETAATAARTAAPDERALALARDIVRIAYPEDKRRAMFFGTVDAMTSQMRGATMARFNNDPAAKAIMDRNLDRFIAASKPIIDRHIPDFMDAYAQGYAREFSVAELEQVLGFMKTPVGQQFLLRSTAIIGDPAFVAANQAYLRDLQPEMDRLRDQLTRELMEHFVKHPPKATTGS